MFVHAWNPMSMFYVCQNRIDKSLAEQINIDEIPICAVHTLPGSQIPVLQAVDASYTTV